MYSYTEMFAQRLIDAIHAEPCMPAIIRDHADRLASVIESGGRPTPDELSDAIGSKNWVLTRRTKRVVERYGDEVVCLSHKQLMKAEMRALEQRAIR